MRTLTFLAATLLAASPLAAQDPELTRPETWQVRFDRAGMAESTGWFVGMPPGWHIRSGHTAGILYDPARTAAGTFTLEAETFLFPATGVREAFGVFLGGRSLDADDQAYVYFLIRGDGSYIVKRRAGRRTETLVPWTRSDAVVPRAAEGTAKNVLRVEVGAEQVRFLVNGTAVASLPAADLQGDGIVGLRVNHNVDIHVATLDVTPSS